MFVPTEGDGSRKRRSRITGGHEPGENKWVKLARHTAKVTNSTTPCWVCSFRPHHAADVPSTVPVPISATAHVCLLWHYQWGRGNRTVLPGCESYTKYANLSNWIQPVNWTVKTNETLKKGLQFAGSTHFREELVAPFCFKRECRKGDWLLGKTPCLDYLGDGFTNREETWATRVAKLHSELVNTTELKCSDCMVIGQRWPLNHTTWTKLVQKTLTYSPWIPVPPRWGFPTPVGQVWLCGSNSYLTLPVNWCGTCTLARLKPSSIVVADTLMQKPLFGDGRGLLATLVPMIGVAASMQRLNEVWWILEDLTEVIDGVLDQMERSPELKAVAAVAMQNRVALDALYAEQGGMCAAVGIDHCCTYIPDDTGNWTAIRNRVKELKDFLESQEDQGPQWTWLNWLNSGSWIHILQKVGIFIGIVLLFCCILFCFVVPLIRKNFETTQQLVEYAQYKSEHVILVLYCWKLYCDF
uniref:Uncharacterized protein n=1 Tax=Neogobius melanostomus TaxID=47308 RepID=A0A8C6TFL1_9GOBI